MTPTHTTADMAAMDPWVKELAAARATGDLEACLAIRRRDPICTDPASQARAVAEERRWHQRQPIQRRTPQERRAYTQGLKAGTDLALRQFDPGDQRDKAEANLKHILGLVEAAD